MSVAITRNDTESFVGGREGSREERVGRAGGDSKGGKARGGERREIERRTQRRI